MDSTLERALDELLDQQLRKSEGYVDEREDELETSRRRERQDPMYEVFGLATEPFFVARYGNGLQTSIHRNVGTFYEKAVRLIASHVFEIPESRLKYSMTVSTSTGEMTRTLDCYVSLADVPEAFKARVQSVIDHLTDHNPQLDLNRPTDLGIEIKGCEKSHDSKRVQAIENMGRHLCQQDVLPHFMLFCNLLPHTLEDRYKSVWAITQGDGSTDLIESLTSVDFKGFLDSRKERIRARVRRMVHDLTG